jgi:chitodextrinase
MCIGFQICQQWIYKSDILVDTTTETTYTVTELTSSTDYTFIVKSKDEAGNLSAASDQETITPKPTQQQIKSKRNYIIINSSILTASTDEAVTGYNYNNEVSY